MAGNIIMGYLLLGDSMRNDEFKTSAEIFIKKGHSANKERADYIFNSELKDLGIFKC